MGVTDGDLGAHAPPLRACLAIVRRSEPAPSSAQCSATWMIFVFMLCQLKHGQAFHGFVR
jgi:hypothetical protein